MMVEVKVIDRNNIIRFTHEFDRRKKIDVEKLKEGLREKYPEPEFTVEVN